jgi:hypothetical protein
MNNASGWLFVMQRIKRDTLIEQKTFGTVRTRELSLFKILPAPGYQVEKL